MSFVMCRTGLLLLSTVLITCCVVAISDDSPIRTFISDSQPIKDAPPVGIVVIAEGRSGSSWLSHALDDMLPSSFIIPEPFYYWRATSRVPPEDPPTFHQLLSCQFFNDPVLFKRVAWRYSCEFYRKRLGVDYYNRCKRGAVNIDDRSKIQEWCENAKVRIIKTIRYQRVSKIEITQSDEDLSTKAGYKLKVLHLVRRPDLVVRSQYLRGWHKAQATTEGMRASTKKVCGHMTRTCTALKQLPLSIPLLRVHYEDMSVAATSSFETWKEMLEFMVRADFGDKITAMLTKSRAKKYGQVGYNSKSKERVNLLQETNIDLEVCAPDKLSDMCWFKAEEDQLP